MTVLLDIILFLVVVEAAAIIGVRAVNGEMSELPQDLAIVGSGLLLMVAVRLAWMNSSALLILLLLAAGGAIHGYGMLKRLGIRPEWTGETSHSSAKRQSSGT